MLGGDLRRKCVVAVDEVNKAKEHLMIIRSKSEADSMSAIYMLIDELSDAMLCTEIYGFMAGTSIRGSGRSGYSPAVLHLECLPYAQQCAVLDKYPGLAGWRCSAEAKELVSYLSGLPRLLQIFIETILREFDGTANFDSVNWHDVKIALTRGSAAKYSWHTASVPLAQRLVDVIMLRRPIFPGSRIMNDSEETYEL